MIGRVQSLMKMMIRSPQFVAGHACGGTARGPSKEINFRRPNLLGPRAQASSYANMIGILQNGEATRAIGVPYKAVPCRVGPGNFTPSPSQIRT